MQPAVLASLDDALVRLRRLWSSPRQVITDEDGRNVEMSSVLVVEACARGAEQGEPVGVGDVAQFADVAPSTASRLVDRAVRAQLVRRTATGGDARRITLQLTDAGRQLRARSLDARMGWLGTVVKDWPVQDLAALAGLLGRFADSLGDVGPPDHRPGS
ncbi:MarR family winged helix-turn-helix transcriptional regulator [Nakamurella sp. GG22]